MEFNREEALKAKQIAEKRFSDEDFLSARNYALKAKSLYPVLEGITQMVATFDVYAASEVKFFGEIDHYSILGLKPSANKDAVKKQYRKLAVLLHPDKNKCVGADGAFKLVSEAWTLLSDTTKRGFYDLQRNRQLETAVNQPNSSSSHGGVVPGFSNCSNSAASHGRLDTFWTVCTSCKVQYEYLRKYVNKRLSCKNCRGIFTAVETGAAPANGSFPYTPWSYVPSNGYGSHGFDGATTYVPSNGTLFQGNGVSGIHSGHGYEYVPSMSFQWSSYSGMSTSVVGPHGSSVIPPDAVYQANGNANKARAKAKSRMNGKRSIATAVANMNLDVPASSDELPEFRNERSERKKKVTVVASFRNGHDERVAKSASEAKLANGNGSIGSDPKIPTLAELHARRCSMAPAFDMKKLLVEKARTAILKKLDEFKSAAEAPAAIKITKRQVEVSESGVAQGHQLKIKNAEPFSINVPDPDFHDFDKDRSEECFKPKQIWALYDEEDGMPRLYCLIREVVSVQPFKLLITYLNSKTDSEFGLVNWLDCGFTKSCGNFRARNLDVIEQVNIFSHVLNGEKAGRGGCVRIFPRKGDIWAMYRNWSRDWDSSTPDDVRHKYAMVEVLNEYSEDLGICVCPLLKVGGFKTVYRSNPDRAAVQWIPRREMLRFSHQVPSWLLNEELSNLPGKCWDLDPAATPDELLHAAAVEAKA